MVISRFLKLPEGGEELGSRSVGSGNDVTGVGLEVGRKRSRRLVSVLADDVGKNTGDERTLKEAVH